jgi:hypothetical protein
MLVILDTDHVGDSLGRLAMLATAVLSFPFMNAALF